MTPRRKSDAALPPAPLELVHPLEVGGGEVPEAVLLDELPPHVSPLLVRTLRLVTAWSAGVEAVAGWREEMEEWEWTLLNREPYGDDEESSGWWGPASVIADELRRPRTVDTERVSHACLALADWCLAVEARISCLRFAEAAALASPALPRWAWIAGRLMRDVGRPREAEHWLNRAIRVATWVEDWETQIRALNTLGNLKYFRGDYAEAAIQLERGIKVAARHSHRQLEAEVAHDLSVVYGMTREYKKVEHYAKRALRGYSPDHPNLPRLAYDIAHAWLEQGYHSRALPVLDALVSHFRCATDVYIRINAAAARAAGACGERDRFETFWSNAYQALGSSIGLPAAAALELGLGAISLGDWERATDLLRQATETAAASDEADVLSHAEVALKQVERQEIGPRTRRPSSARIDGFTQQLISAVRGGSGGGPDAQFPPPS